MNTLSEKAPDEIRIAPMTPTELAEYRAIQKEEEKFFLHGYDKGDHYSGVNVPGEALLIHPDDHIVTAGLEANFRKKAGMLCRRLISKHADKVMKYNPLIWEPAVIDGWLVMCRKDAIVGER